MHTAIDSHVHEFQYFKVLSQVLETDISEMSGTNLECVLLTAESNINRMVL